MDIQLNVPSLEDLAFEMSYKEIMSNLILCYEHRPEGKRVPWLPFSSIVTTSEILSSSENIRSHVRNRLNQHLVGIMGDKVREKYVKKFYDSFSNCAEESQLVEPWAFLDCILEENIDALEIYAAFPNSSPNLKLIPTITKWSPHLKKMTLNFNCTRDLIIADKVEVIERVKSLIQSLDSLQYLTHLLLFDISGKVKFPVLSLVGKSCPKLNHLTVENCRMWVKPLLALIFGQLLDELADFDHTDNSSWWSDEALTNLVVPIEFLTPICSSLRELRLLGYDFKQRHVTKHAVAFALRHFPMLQRIYGMRTSQAVTTLHETEEWRSQEQFRMACQEAAKRGNFNLPTLFPSRNLSCTFNGHLLLTRIEDVNVYYREMLNAVGALCPMLEEVVFCSNTFGYGHPDDSEFESESEQPITLESTVSPKHLKSILRAWPKLTSIECEEVPWSHMKAILTVFGPDLHKLRLERCHRIKLEQLAICSKLESLKIVYGALLSQRSQETDCC